jgi:ATPase family associated with various cellular activities (AAA)
MTTPTFAFPVRLSEKYRPRKVSDFVGLPKAKRVLSKFVAHPYACSFLFFGPPGVGKTSMAQAMADEMGAEFHHLGSQRCNLENLEEICRICQYVPLTGGFRFVLIDEVDSASRAAQRRTRLRERCSIGRQRLKNRGSRLSVELQVKTTSQATGWPATSRNISNACGTRKAETATRQTSLVSPKTAATTSATVWADWKWS